MSMTLEELAGLMGSRLLREVKRSMDGTFPQKYESRVRAALAGYSVLALYELAGETEELEQEREIVRARFLNLRATLSASTADALSVAFYDAVGSGAKTLIALAGAL